MLETDVNGLQILKSAIIYSNWSRNIRVENRFATLHNVFLFRNGIVYVLLRMLNYLKSRARVTSWWTFIQVCSDDTLGEMDVNTNMEFTKKKKNQLFNIDLDVCDVWHCGGIEYWTFSIKERNMREVHGWMSNGPTGRAWLWMFLNT